MSFFSNAVKLIKNKKSNSENTQVSDNLELDFSLRNYAKESFAVLIINPISNYFMKFMRITSFVITGGILGSILSVLAIYLFMQFGSVENKFISYFIDNQINSLFPDADFSVKSSKISWNVDKHALEIALKKLKLDDITIPSVYIFPNISESIKQHKCVIDGVNVVNPKINLKFSDDFKSIYFDPNFEKNNSKKILTEPISALKGFSKLLNDSGDLKVINADVSIEENGVVWNLNNAYIHYNIGEQLLNALSFKVKLPKQNCFSSFNMVKTQLADLNKYIVNFDSCNPKSLREILLKRNTPINDPIINAILENSLPISGLVHFDVKNGKILKGDFDLIGGAGAVKIPAKNALSLNLGKAIDNGSISGTFSADGIDIKSININYEDSGIQMTGVHIPMVEYNLMDIANINGTLALSNVGVSEMTAILPEDFALSIVPTFRNYLDGFKLDLFKVDINGSVAFGRRSLKEPISIGNGTFKISDAKIPLGKTLVRDVNALGTITEDGLDIKLSGAKLGDTIIKKGDFFISKKDNSWIGTINADISANEVKKYANDISKKLNSLHINTLNVAKTANVDMKLVKIEGDNLKNKELPFRIVEGSGVLKSRDNTKKLKFSWNEKELNLSGEVNEGKSDVILALEENFEKNEGSAEFNFKSNSNFLKNIIPNIDTICSGDYSMSLNMGWKGDVTQYELNTNLKNAMLTLPVIGDLKLKNTDGSLKAKLLMKDDLIDISEFSINTVENKIAGNMLLGKDGRLYKCSFNDFIVGKNDVKINIVRDTVDKVALSIVGKKFDTSLLNELFKILLNNETISCYLDLNEILVAGHYLVKNVKGSVEFKNGKIVNGACYGVIGKDTTLALSTQPNANGDSIVSLSASNAEEFLKYFKVSSCIKGGTLNFMFKSDIISDNAMSGAFELSDFIVKNDQLTRLISFSSMNGMANPETYTVGFNFCVGNFVLNDELIKIEGGKAVGPTVGISYSGSYNRLEDRFEISGLCLMRSSLLNFKESGGAYAAPYEITGSLGKPALAVKLLQFVPDTVINDIFGNLIPTMPTMGNMLIGPSSENPKDPFSSGAFDNTVTDAKAKTLTKNTKKTMVFKTSSEKKFGVKINRGRKVKQR